MGSKYSSELKPGQNHNHGDASTSYTRADDESSIDNLNVFHVLSCWRCICFRPRQFKATRSKPSDDSFSNNNNKSPHEMPLKGGSDNHAMQAKPAAGPLCNEGWHEKASEGQVEAYQNDQNAILADTNKPNCKETFSAPMQRMLGHDKRSISLKSCRSCLGNSVSGTNGSVGPSGQIAPDVRRNFFSRLMSLSVDGKQRLGYVRQVDTAEVLAFSSEFDAEEEKSERDELLDHGRFSCERQRPDFLGPIDSMEYLDSTPSTEDRFNEACFRLRGRATDNISSDLYEESCLENLESFCDRSILLASMDTIDLGSSVESLLPPSRDNAAFDRSPLEGSGGYVTMDLATYKTLVDELEACRKILGQLESLLSGMCSH